MTLALVLSVLISQDVFQDAERLYNAGRYGEAAAAYESLVTQGVVDGNLYYNLGNANFKSGRLGSAILSYERALRLLPGDDDAEANLAFANEQIVDRVDRPPLPAYVAWGARLYRGIDADTWATLLSLSFVVGGCATSLLLLDRYRRAAGYVLVAAAVFGALFGAILAAKLGAGRVEEAVLLTPRAEVRSGPGEPNPQLAEIHEGLKLEVRSEREGWLQVTLPNGLTGWVPRANVGII